MRHPYLCAYHVERLKACESEALRYWGEMMRRGVQAYVACRIEAATLYLGTALEIGLLRQRCQLNGVFEGLHIVKPAEFLVELLKVDRQYGEVNELLEYVVQNANLSADMSLESFLARAFIPSKNTDHRVAASTAAAPALIH